MLAASLNDSERFPGSTVSRAAGVGRRQRFLRQHEMEGGTSVFLRGGFHQSLKLKGRFVTILTFTAADLTTN